MRGGKRDGAGRPSNTKKDYKSKSVRIPEALYNVVKDLIDIFKKSENDIKK